MASRGLFGSKSGSDTIATISPVLTSAMTPAEALALIFFARGDELVAQRELHAQIEREIDRPLQLVGGKPRHVQRGEPLPIEPLLDAGDALVVDVHVADLVRDHRPVGIDALVLGQEADAGNAEPMDLLLLARRDLALEPDEAPLRRQALAHFVGVEIGQHRGEQFNRFVHVDDLARLGEQRRRLHVGGEDLPVAVEDVGTRGSDGVCATLRRPPWPSLTVANITSRSAMTEKMPTKATMARPSRAFAFTLRSTSRP